MVEHQRLTVTGVTSAMARHLAPKGVHVSLIIIDGGVGKPEADAKPKTLDPADIAHTAAFLAKQPPSAWTFEVDVRPQLENW